MGQKVNCNPLKLTSIVSYLQKSRTAHNIKDLEKHLPSVASINGMQVKDYIQNLQDENKIRVEKIGSGNWYWNFASEDKKLREKALVDAEAAHEKASAIVQDLKQKLTDAQAQRDTEAEMLDGGAESREDLNAAKAELEKEVKELQKQLAAYSDSDPTELERMRTVIETCKEEVDTYTDNIYSMEGWFKNKLGADEHVKQLRMMLYGDEYDEEDEMLREM